jgi:hypothetical protein
MSQNSQKSVSCTTSTDRREAFKPPLTAVWRSCRINMNKRTQTADAVAMQVRRQSNVGESVTIPSQVKIVRHEEKFCTIFGIAAARYYG